jgi:hypothetical protein
MLSGIGAASQLSPVGVDTIVDLPDVGQNLQVPTSGEILLLSSLMLRLI